MLKVRKEIFYGVIGALSLALLGLGLSFFSGNPFTRYRLQLYAEYSNSQGLLEGAPVSVNGFVVGKVGEITLDLKRRKNRVRIDFEEHLEIPANAEAMIYTTDLLGSKALKIMIPESFSPRVVANQGTLTGTVEESMMGVSSGMVENQASQILMEAAIIARELNGLVVTVKKLVDDPNNQNAVSHTLSSVQQTAENLSMLTTDLKGTLQKADQIATHASSVAAAMDGNREEIDVLITKAAITADTLAASSANLRNVLRQIDGTTQSLDRVLAKVQAGEGTLGALIHDRTLYDSLTVSSARLNNLLQSVQNNPTRYFDDIKVYLIERKAKD